MVLAIEHGHLANEVRLMALVSRAILSGYGSPWTGRAAGPDHRPAPGRARAPTAAAAAPPGSAPPPRRSPGPRDAAPRRPTRRPNPRRAPTPPGTEPR